ncbi:MAG: hypothetical protein AAFO83_03400 [Cyanobacteria bacterium J06607_13]
MSIQQLAQLFSTTEAHVSNLIAALGSSDESLIEQVFNLVDEGVEEPDAIAQVKAEAETPQGQHVPTVDDRQIARNLAERRATAIVMQADLMVMDFLSGRKQFGSRPLEVIEAQAETLTEQLDADMGNAWDALEQGARQASLPSGSRLQLLGA